MARYFQIGFGALALIGIPLACAEEAELETALDGSPVSGDAGGDDELDTGNGGEPNATDGDAASNDAASESDARPEPGTCSASKICVASVPIDEKVNLTSVWGSSASDVYAVGSDSVIVHYDGAVWEKAPREAPAESGIFTLQSVWLERPDDVWIADGNRIRHGTGWSGPTETEWSYAQLGSGYLTSIRGKDNAVWTAATVSKGNGYYARYGGWNNGPGTAQPMVQVTGASYTALTISRPGEVWLVGGWKTGTRQLVFRAFLPATDGGPPAAWQREEHDARSWRRLLGAWGDESAVWLVGEGGTLRRMTASAVPNKVFERVDSPVVEDLYDVFGFAADDVWAVGEACTVLHWDGTSWSRLSTPFDHTSKKPRLLAVWGSSPADVWIVGQGTVLHFQENAR